MKNVELTNWGHGLWIDRWTLLHIVWGVIYALVFRFFKFSVEEALLLTIVAAIVWELYEHYFIIVESWPNKICDILVTIPGFYFAYWILPIAYAYDLFTAGACFLFTILATLVAHKKIRLWNS